MNIKIDELKKAIDRIFLHLAEERGITEFEIKKSNYWNIPFPNIYDPNESPRDYDIGSLYDDWEFASSLLDNSKQPLVYQLVELSAIIRYLGETLGRDLAPDGG